LHGEIDDLVSLACRLGERGVLGEIIFGLIFVASGTIFFNERFRHNPIFLGLAGVVALTSTYFLVKSIVNEEFAKKTGIVATAFQNFKPTAEIPGEECLAIEIDYVRKEQIGGLWQVTDGKTALLTHNASEEIADKVIDIVRFYHLNRKCQIKDMSGSMEYWKSGDTIPRGKSELDTSCFPLNSWEVSVFNAPSIGGSQVIDNETSGRQRSMLFFKNEATANAAADAIKHYDFGWECYVGKPHAPFRYWLIAG
jgi:hypothetical protein